jgi:hypothetical protein
MHLCIVEKHTSSSDTRAEACNTLALHCTTHTALITLPQSLSAKSKVKLVEQEMRQLRRAQDALVSLGAHRMIMLIIGRARTFLTAQSKAPAARLLPRVLEFGAALLAHGNERAQTAIMDAFFEASEDMK